MTEIAAAIAFSKSGRLSEYLHELELSGFIHRDYSWSLRTSQQSSMCTYRLKDNHLNFYLRYIAPKMSRAYKDDYAFESQAVLPNWNTLFGLKFDSLVLYNRKRIHELLVLDSNDIVNDNPYMQRTT